MHLIYLSHLFLSIFLILAVSVFYKQHDQWKMNNQLVGQQVVQLTRAYSYWANWEFIVVSFCRIPVQPAGEWRRRSFLPRKLHRLQRWGRGSYIRLRPSDRGYPAAERWTDQLAATTAAASVR